MENIPKFPIGGGYAALAPGWFQAVAAAFATAGNPEAQRYLAWLIEGTQNIVKNFVIRGDTVVKVLGENRLTSNRAFSTGGGIALVRGEGGGTAVRFTMMGATLSGNTATYPGSQPQGNAISAQDLTEVSFYSFTDCVFQANGVLEASFRFSPRGLFKDCDFTCVKGILLSKSSPRLVHDSFNHSSSEASDRFFISCEERSSPTGLRDTFNGGGVVRYGVQIAYTGDLSKPEILSSNFAGFTSRAVYNVGNANQPDFRGCYWNSATGPQTVFHNRPWSRLNPGGTGEKVSSSIDWSYFSTTLVP